MGSTHQVNPAQSQRHRLANVKRKGVTLFTAPGHATRTAARNLAEKASGSPDGAEAYLRADGSWCAVVRLVPERWWLLEHVNYSGCVAWPAAYALPRTGLASLAELQAEHAANR